MGRDLPSSYEVFERMKKYLLFIICPLVIFWITYHNVSAQYQVPQVPVYKQQATFSTTDDLLNKILEKVTSIDETLKNNKVATKLELVNVMTNKCLSCHSAQSKIPLFDNDKKLLAYSVIEQRAIVEAVKSGRMPKNDSLTQEEKNVFKSLEEGSK